MAGYILARLDIIDKQTQRKINVVQVTLLTPCLMTSKIAFSLTREKLREMWIIPIGWVGGERRRGGEKERRREGEGENMDIFVRCVWIGYCDLWKMTWISLIREWKIWNDGKMKGAMEWWAILISIYHGLFQNALPPHSCSKSRKIFAISNIISLHLSVSLFFNQIHHHIICISRRSIRLKQDVPIE